MWPVFVIVFSPFFGYLPHLGNVPEDVHIKDAPSVRAIEALDVSVLHRFAGLGEHMLYPVASAPLLKDLGDELRAVVGPDLPRLSMLRYRKLDKADKLLGRYRVRWFRQRQPRG